MEQRIDPEIWLQQIQAESAKGLRGQLKIFFGYAAGVGKTYAMLEAARAAKIQGIDVVAGYIEPHTRPETMALLEGLERLSSLEVEHKGILLYEFDLDAALARKPDLILVDELAHSNASCCRHQKRYQDIEELLKAGIDVYTTVNVQHIESLNDLVASITGVIVRERIPDRVFDDAAQVELVDLEPSELVLRLQQGKVCQGQQAQTALGNFFTEDNLIALREIALRRTADRINHNAERKKQMSAGNFYTDEHILVCLSSSPSNAKLIRTAARMAYAFKGKFTALYVETAAQLAMSKEDQKRLQSNTKLAQQLGAVIETVPGEDIALQIAEFARLAGVSKIVIGRSSTRRGFFFTSPSFSEKLTILAPNLDIYIIPDKTVLGYQARRFQQEPSKLSWLETSKMLLMVLLATLVGLSLQAMGLTEANVIMIYILGVLLTSIWCDGRLYSLAASLLSVFAFNFLFIEPYYTLKAYGADYPVTFLIMFLVALLSGSLTGKIKRQAKASARKAYRTQVLLETNQLLQQAREPEEILSTTARQLIKLLDQTVTVYGVQEGKLTAPQVFMTGRESEERKRTLTGDNEQAVAYWVYRNNKHAGATTNTLGSAQCLYLAVRGSSQVLAVVGIAFEQEGTDSFTDGLLYSILGECGLALEKELSNRKKEEAVARARNEQLRANLLRSISHDLRTPLTTISGNASILMDNGSALDDGKKQKLYTDIYDDAMWLVNLVENLLSITRIEDGSMQLHLEAELIEEVIEEALRHVGRQSEEHPIRFVPNEALILVKMDARLMIQVIINIVDNAIKYTPAGSEIIIQAVQENAQVRITIADNGPGIRPEMKTHIFDMFYTGLPVAADSRRGLGLGLALCRSIVEAHGGTIGVMDNVPQGTVFYILLQAKEAKAYA